MEFVYHISHRFIQFVRQPRCCIFIHIGQIDRHFDDVTSRLSWMKVSAFQYKVVHYIPETPADDKSTNEHVNKLLSPMIAELADAYMR